MFLGFVVLCSLQCFGTEREEAAHFIFWKILLKKKSGIWKGFGSVWGKTTDSSESRITIPDMGCTVGWRMAPPLHRGSGLWPSLSEQSIHCCAIPPLFSLNFFFIFSSLNFPFPKILLTKLTGATPICYLVGEQVTFLWWFPLTLKQRGTFPWLSQHRPPADVSDVCVPIQQGPNGIPESIQQRQLFFTAVASCIIQNTLPLHGFLHKNAVCW